MYSNFAAFIFCILSVTVSTENVIINVFQRLKRDVSEDCRPQPPTPGQPHEVCCEIPNLFNEAREVFEACHATLHKNTPDTAVSSITKQKHRLFARYADHGQEHQHPPPLSPERRNCLMECVFNNSGFLTSDGMLNEDVLMQKWNDRINNNAKWSSVGPAIHKKCIAVAKEAVNVQGLQSCKAGPGEYAKCLAREAFFNCPSDVWSNSGECNEIKARLERCPDLPPPPPPHH